MIKRELKRQAKLVNYTFIIAVFAALVIQPEADIWTVIISWLAVQLLIPLFAEIETGSKLNQCDECNYMFYGNPFICELVKEGLCEHLLCTQICVDSHDYFHQEQRRLLKEANIYYDTANHYGVVKKK